VNKATMIERMAGACAREEDRRHSPSCATSPTATAIRVVIELKREAMVDVVLNQLYRFTPLQTSFGCNMVALDGGRPLVDESEGHADRVHRVPRGCDLPAHQVPARQGRATSRQSGRPRHSRSANIDEVIKLHPLLEGRQRGARQVDGAGVAGQHRGRADRADSTIRAIGCSSAGTAKLTAEQTKAILDLRLQRLTALGRDEIKDELDKLAKEISDYLDILRSRARIQAIVKDELLAVKDEFATPRRTVIAEQEGEVEDEDLIHREDMVVTVSHLGYVKRVPLSTYRMQRRGGKGRSGMQTRDEDFVSRLFVASTHTPVLFFSSLGRVYKEKVWRLPIAAPQARGKPLINILPIEQGELMTSILPLPEDETTWGNLDVVFATTKGTVRRNKLSGLRRRAALRHHRHEARRGRGHRRRAGLFGEGRRAADDRRRASASASRSPTCACSRAAPRWACAASRSPKATG
jgi:DNA gyrase subunit A